MARCDSCKKDLGLGILSRWKKLDGHNFCQPCSIAWLQERRQCVLLEIFGGAAPTEAFRILRVRTKNPYRPKTREILLGMALFTDKGVCFFQLGSHEKADPGWGLVFGAIGAIIAESSAKDRQKKSSEQIERNILNADGLADLLQQVEQVFYYPREDISKIKFDSVSFTIHNGKSKKRFVYEGGRKIFKQFRDTARAYSRAMETGADPIQELQRATTPSDHTNPYA